MRMSTCQRARRTDAGEGGEGGSSRSQSRCAPRCAMHRPWPGRSNHFQPRPTVPPDTNRTDRKALRRGADLSSLRHPPLCVPTSQSLCARNTARTQRVWNLEDGGLGLGDLAAVPVVDRRLQDPAIFHVSRHETAERERTAGRAEERPHARAPHTQTRRTNQMPAHAHNRINKHCMRGVDVCKTALIDEAERTRRASW